MQSLTYFVPKVTSPLEIEIVRNNEFFILLDVDLIQELLLSKKERSFRKNELVYTSSYDGERFVFVRRGSVKNLFYLSDGREIVLDSVFSGKVFAEVNILREEKSNFESRAMEDTVCWFFEGKMIREAIQADVELSGRMLQYALRRLADLEVRLLSQAQAGLAARLASTLIRLLAYNGLSSSRPMPAIHISQQELASMLPASREKVNKCLRAWKRAEIIDLEPGTIIIKDINALSSHAQL